MSESLVVAKVLVDLPDSLSRWPALRMVVVLLLDRR